MRETVTIRPLAASDSITELTDLLHRAYAPLAAMGLRYSGQPTSPRTPRACGSSQGTCLVAVMDHTICGTILFKDAGQTRGCPWYDQDDIASIAQFAVDPACSRKASAPN